MIEKIAYNLHRNDEEPNILLAELLCNTEDAAGIHEIAEGLADKKKEIANDCIKVLYEIGERKPELIGDYAQDFIQLLQSKNNRLVWGGMTALAKIASLRHQEIFENFDIVKKAYEEGSVITVDNAVSVFAGLCRAGSEYERTVFPLILNHLQTCGSREVSQHAERAFVCVNQGNAKAFAEVLLQRKDALTEAQQKRVDKLIRKIDTAKYST